MRRFLAVFIESDVGVEYLVWRPVEIAMIVFFLGRVVIAVSLIYLVPCNHE